MPLRKLNALAACLVGSLLAGCSTSAKPPGAPLAPADGAAGAGAAGTTSAGGTTGAAGTTNAAAGTTGAAGTTNAAAGATAAAGSAGPTPDAGTSAADAAIEKPPAGPLVWTAAADCPLARFEAMSAVDGTKVLVLGGFLGNVTPTARVDAFDVATGQWSRRKDMPAPLTHAGVAPVGGKVYFAGGFTGAFVQGIPADVADVWIHDLAADTWTPGPALPTRRAAIALVRIGDLLHAVGGLGADSNSDIAEHLTLAPAGGTSWTPAAPALVNGRNHLGGVAIGDDLYVVGGRHGWDEQNGHQRTLNRLASGSAAWSTLASLDVGRSEIGASTFTAFGRLYVIGGSVMGVKPVPDVLRYDPATDKWTALTPLPAPRKGAVAAAIGNKIVVTTGSPTSTDPIATTWVGCCID